MTVTYIQRTPLDLAHDDVARIDKEIDALQEQIASLQGERDKVVAFIDMYGKYVKPQPMSPAIVGPSMPSVDPPAHERALPRLKVPLNIQIGNFMARKMADLDRPIPISTVCEMLFPNNLMPGGKDPKQAVSAILGKDRRFKYAQGEGWSLVRQQTFAGPEKENQ